jgi:hypothetical protein
MFFRELQDHLRRNQFPVIQSAPLSLLLRDECFLRYGEYHLSTENFNFKTEEKHYLL